MFVVHNKLHMEFVDRIAETARLEAALSGEKSTLVVMYGRRRLGKSTLIKRALSDGDVYFLADRSEGRHQRLLLAKVIAQVFPDFDKLTYPDWESLFRAVNYRTDRRFTLCVDEKQLKYNLVLCGSSQNMMYGLFLDAAAPLYGRADEIIRLTPIRLPYLQEALSLDAVSAVEEYSVWGGVPRYWELRDSRESFGDALWHNIFSVNGVLYEEPVKLFQDDVKDIVKTSTIMSYVGAGANRLSEIAARCGEPATNLSRPLKKLVDLGFLEKDVPYGIDEKNAKKSLYKITDPFMAFYYQFVVPYRSFIELDRRLPIEQALSARFQEYVSMQWEKLCREAVTGNLMDGVLYGRARRWWGSVLNEHGKPEQIEFDVMAESMDKKCLLVGECKWTARENGRRLAAELLRKAALLPFTKDYTVVPVLFLKNEPTDNSANVMLPQDVIGLLK